MNKQTFMTTFNQSIQLRLTIYFIVILLPLILLSMFMNVRSKHILEQEISERTVSAMNSALEYIDLTMDGVKNLAVLVSTDRSLTTLLNETGEELTTKSLLEFTQIMQQITNITAVNTNLAEVTVLHGHSKKLLNSRIGSLNRPQVASEAWYQQIMSLNGSFYLYLPEENKVSLTGWIDPIHNKDQIILMQLMDMYNRERGGNVVMLSVHKKLLLSYLMNLVPSEASQIYLFDEKKRLVVTSSTKVEEIAAMQSLMVTETNLTIKQEKNMILHTESLHSGWSLMLIQPEKEIFKKTEPLQMFSYLIILISCLLAVWIAWFVYSNIASPIVSLVSGMRQLRLGNLDTKLQHNRQDELGYLTDSFNQTVEQQRYLIRNIYEQQLRLTKTELKFLQSQINPHFLYNTLDSIYWTAKNYDAEEISEMVLNLSQFFRLSLSKGRDTFTVEETFGHLQYYIRVQQLRFVDQFTVHYSITDECKGLYVLKLILQPLVENAILHGLEKVTGAGTLMISAKVEEEMLVLQVMDNGRGIGSKRLEQLQHALLQKETFNIEETIGKNTAFFGLLNVRTRIKLYYGEQANLTIVSNDGEGTTATIELPLSYCGQRWEEQSSEGDDRRG